MSDYRSSLPQDFVNRMNEMLGDEAESFFASYGRERRHGLRMNQLKQVESLPIPLGKEVLWWKHAYEYADDVTPGRHPLHDAGAYYIQEPSAMAPVSYLDVRPGMRVLDLCAAPGGKSTQIGELLQGEGILVCNEIHPARAKILSENIERIGVANAIVTNTDPDTLSNYFPGFFDRVLVDAPCSGEGMFVKNQDAATTEWSLENVQICADRQDMILEAADRMLSYGGRMVYSTCTFAPAEDEGSIARFLQLHPEYQVVEVLEDMETQGLCPGRPEWLEGECSDEIKEAIKRTIRLWPHKMEGEGHYLAVLQKGEAIENLPQAVPKAGGKSKKKSKGGKQQKAAIDPKAAVREFCEQELLITFDEDRLQVSGDQIYLLPVFAPTMNGLKVLRPGLHMGTLKKNRFEPAHALAHALQPQQAKHSIEVSEADALKVLRGETLNAEGPNGWYLICIGGCALGWGKMTNGIIKNHYPKGLRR